MLEIWGADVGNAYLEAYTDEKLCIIAGPEFKELQGHLLIMIKVLYGTCSGGARWHDRLFDILQELKFKPSKADPDVWMRPEPGGTCYEYIAVYVDDLAIAAKDPQAFCNELKKKYNLKLKGVGPLEYHLGCTYKKAPDGTLAADPRRYVNKILESYERMFKEKPKKSRPPLEGVDHPERHHLVSYHRVREAIAAKYISFHWKDGKSNTADILSKHWEFATVWPMLKPILFWRGETATQLKGSDPIQSTTPGEEPPRDARDSGSARSHSTHLETISSDQPKMVTYTEPQTLPSYMFVKCT